MRIWDEIRQPNFPGGRPAFDLKNVYASEVTQIAVTVSPGYYTGIRIGISYACALAEALRISVVPVPTLYAFIRDLLPLSVPIAPILRARKNFIRLSIRDRKFQSCAPSSGTDTFAGSKHPPCSPWEDNLIRLSPCRFLCCIPLRQVMAGRWHSRWGTHCFRPFLLRKSTEII